MYKIILTCVLFISPLVNSQYNANIKGVIDDDYVYTDGNHIYFRFVNQPTEHSVCKPNYFVLGADIPSDRLDRLLTRLLTAHTTKEEINIGYDNSVECARGYIKVHRVG